MIAEKGLAGRSTTAGLAGLPETSQIAVWREHNISVTLFRKYGL